MSVRIENNILNVFNPATGKDVGTIPISTINEMNAIFTASKKAAVDYNISSLHYRGRLVTKFRKQMVARMDDFIQIICDETGKKSEEAVTEIFTSVEHMKQAVKLSKVVLSPERRRTGLLKTKKATVVYEPMGVAGIISPWNYPLILTVTPLIEALLAGNTVVLKPSEQTPLTVKLLKEVWDDATNVADVFQVVYGAGGVGHHLVTTPETDVICFTGSTAVGQKIAEACAPLFKPVILELGGKDPMVVMEDAHLDRAADAAIWGGMSNAGQTCTSVEKLYIHSTRKDEFITMLKNRIEKLKTGPGDDNHVGAVTVSNSRDKILSQIDEVRGHADIIEGTVSGNNGGWFIPPTLIIDPPKTAKILKEETFGPVIIIESYDNETELIQKTNDSNGYGLSASIFTRNRKKGRKIASQIRTGAVNINDVMTQYGIADLPFGGVGKSGIGKVHGEEGLKAFSRVKSILENRFTLKSEMWWFANSKSYGRMMKKFIKWYYG